MILGEGGGESPLSQGSVWNPEYSQQQTVFGEGMPVGGARVGYCGKHNPCSSRWSRIGVQCIVLHRGCLSTRSMLCEWAYSGDNCEGMMA